MAKISINEQLIVRKKKSLLLFAFLVEITFSPRYFYYTIGQNSLYLNVASPIPVLTNTFSHLKM